MAFTMHFVRSTRASLNLNKHNTLYNLYSRVLSSDLFVKEAFVQEVVRKLRWIQPAQLASTLELWINLLQHCKRSDIVSTEIEHLENLLTEFNERFKPDMDADESDSSSEDDADARFLKVSSAMDSAYRRKTKVSQRAGVVVQVKEGSFEVFALRACQIFERFVGAHTKHYTDYLFNEIYYFQDDKIVTKNFQPQPRPIIQSALGAASEYLSCECCAASGVLHANAIDICLLYKLHSECGHLINLYDLFNGFELVVAKERPEPSLGDIQARFSAGLTHLEFLGFIKPTTRKTDHVLKMTASFL
ncbi:Origin recognition complex subunit 3 [Podochytrium sp. JEL0797]|nr:Origin recognition complex subunit 3 [Podochytrium sp. JEL0797]